MMNREKLGSNQEKPQRNRDTKKTNTKKTVNLFGFFS
jgi:hypothetical protein